jgi:DNA-binding MarR family transcriptional regulator
MATQKRQRRDKRSITPTPMRLTERDKAIIHAVHTYRVLRQAQLERLFFGSQSTAQRVLQRLYQHGFLERKFFPVLTGRSPTMYVLDKKGAELLRSDYGLENLVWYPSSKELKTEFLEHTTAINEFRITVTLAAQFAGYELLNWQGENDLKAQYDRVRIMTGHGKSQMISLIPDSYFVLKTPRGFAHFFLELDRGTMTTKRFKSKIQAYLAYYQSGAYSKRYNSRSMRVVTVTNGVKRLENLKTVTEDAKGKHQFWFALASDLTPDIVLSASVWQIAGEMEKQPLIAVV